MFLYWWRKETSKGFPIPKKRKKKRNKNKIALLQVCEKFGGHPKNSISHGM
jgi:hypothetical protein